MCHRISISARRSLATIAVSASIVVSLGSVAFAEQATRLRIAENSTPRPVDRVFFTYNYFTQITIEGGVSSGETTGGIGNSRDPVKFERTFFGGDVAVGMRAPFQSPLTGIEAAVSLGVKFRSYFGDEGDPNQVLVHYSRDWMVMPYIAMPLAFPKPGQPPGGKQFVLTPFIGPIFEQGKLSIFNNQGQASVTRHGLGVGLNFDVVFPSASGFRPFVGAGGQLSFMQSVKEDIDGFDTHLDRDVQARAVVRGGVIFSP